MNDIAGLIEPLVALRREIHAHPELGFAEHRTAARVAETLRAAGIEVHDGICGTGVVGVLRAGSGSRALGLRADMDALPIDEQTNLPWTSTVPGCFHGCGHDGHVAMLLGAAQLLARDPDFSGTLNLIFQPAEEGKVGAREMIVDGLFERFPWDRIYALHNWPGLPAGTIATRPGAIMGAADKFQIVVSGRGGHAALPQDTRLGRKKTVCAPVKHRERSQLLKSYFCRRGKQACRIGRSRGTGCQNQKRTPATTETADARSPAARARRAVLPSMRSQCTPR
ncbi:MAG: amidohydrolase [Novosphingobium sp.]